MKILLYSPNFSPELTGIGKYNGEFVEWLVSNNHQVEVITAPPYYPEWKVHKGYKSLFYNIENNGNLKVTRCPLYVPNNVTTVKRIIHLTSFALSSTAALMSKLFIKPDVIILVQPTLFCAPFTLLYAKLTGAKSIMHIQDYEVDAMLGLGFLGNKPKSGGVEKLARNIEKWLMSKFDAISTISYSMLENAKNKGITASKLIHFPNWSDINFVTPDFCGSNLKSELGFLDDDKIILYSGNIGKKQGLEIILLSAQHFLSDEHIKFLIVGTGAYVNDLKKMAKNLKLNNVYFESLLPWAKVPELLALADIHLVIQKKGAADAVLPSKLTNILAAGGEAIVTAEHSTELGQIINKHPKIFNLIEPEIPELLTNEISRLVTLEKKGYNVEARNYAEKYLDKNIILPKIVEELSSLLSDRN